jgi:hypothetical protein
MLNLENKKKYIQVLRGLAMLSVASAHVSAVSSNNFIAYYGNLLLNSIGSVGVVVFFVISGLLFRKKQYSFAVFWKRKLKKIVPPWFFCGFIIYLYVVLRKGGETYLGFFKYLFAYSHFYYLLMLLCLFFLCWKIEKKLGLLIGAALISCISIILTSLNLIKFVYPYINPI